MKSRGKMQRFLLNGKALKKLQQHDEELMRIMQILQTKLQFQDNDYLRDIKRRLEMQDTRNEGEK